MLTTTEVVENSSSSSSDNEEELYNIEDEVEPKKEAPPIKYRTPPIDKLNSLLGHAQAYSNFLATRLGVGCDSNGDAVSAAADGVETTNNNTEQTTTFKQPSLLTGTTLKPYQLEGVQWLISLFENGLNGILADEMGLGKTVQVIGFISFLKEMEVNGPFIIVVPLSCLSNWLKEIERFAPALSVDTIKYHGTPEKRESLRSSISNTTILLTSFEITMRDSTLIGDAAGKGWKYMVIDEGHRLKNMNCRLIHELKHSFKTENRLLMTGTPLQNNLSELWSLLNFLLPMIFDDIDDFLSWFDPVGDGFINYNSDGGDDDVNSIKEKMVQRLHNILKPLLLRRLKKDVELGLPEKVEFLVKIPLGQKQCSLYNSIIKGKLREWIGEDLGLEKGTDYLGGSLMNKTMQLRKACNHAFLFENAVSEPTLKDLLENGSKLPVLEQILNDRIAKGHKVLLFSQMSKMLDILSMFLNFKGINYSRLDGSVSHEEREKEIEAFQQKKDIPVFLLSTRAGGLGINLTEADTVIFYDSDWNPQVDLQAQDRAHRIGQKRKVSIIRMCTQTPSIEERMIARAIQKRHLERVVIHSKKFKGKRSLLAEDPLIDLSDKDFEQMISNEISSVYGNLITDSNSPSQIDVSILQSDNEYLHVKKGVSASELSLEQLEILFK